MGLTHVQRGNARGAVALLRRGAERVSGYTGTPPHGIDAAGIARATAGLAARIEAAGDTAVACSSAADQPDPELKVQAARLRTGASHTPRWRHPGSWWPPSAASPSTSDAVSAYPVSLTPTAAANTTPSTWPFGSEQRAAGVARLDIRPDRVDLPGYFLDW